MPPCGGFRIRRATPVLDRIAVRRLRAMRSGRQVGAVADAR
jgi:hypothetical protein